MQRSSNTLSFLPTQPVSVGGLRRFAVLWLLISTSLPAQSEARAATKPATAPYFPGRFDDWQRRTPDDVGMNAEKIATAVAFAQASFNEKGGYNAANEPFPATIGPVKAPSGMNGIILRHGYIIAEWGDTWEVDMTFSVTKTYLSTTAGLAFDDKLINKLNDPVRRYVPDGHFDAPHNRPITWHQLLNQTSGWEGTLFAKPDWSDRFRKEKRPREYPGKHWRYNDVRVNQLALALLHVWRKPLPQVLKSRIMDPIGASNTWRWNGYSNSWIVVDGVRMQSVSGGGHWGGGMFINSRDHARFGYLFLRDGNWNGRQLISKAWIEKAKTPTPQMPTYGYMNWFLNTDTNKRYDEAPVGSVFFLGAGTNMVWIDPTHDLVVVVRWLKRSEVNRFIGKVMAALSNKGR